MALLSFIKKYDWVMIGSAVLLVCYGFLGIWSASVAKSSFSNFEKQIIFFGIGLIVMGLVSFFDYRIFRNNSFLILTLYGICLVLLVGLQFFAPVIKGTQGWYKIGFLSLDPNEPSKLILIILLAKYFSMRHVEMYKFRHIIFSGVYTALLALFIFLKPDLGGTMVVLSIWLGVLLISGIRINHFAILSACFLIVAALGWNFILHDYQKQRITAFMFPYDYYGASWSQNQTRISIGSGQWTGKGLAQGSQVQWGFLPEPHTDFIFSVLAHEWGLLGVIVVFSTYAVLMWRIIRIAVSAESNFPRLFASGFAIMLAAQFFLNIGMNLSMLPVVGIALPFISYGGSGLIANFIGIGILQSIVTRNG